jgi:hypothetical protein
MTENVTPDNAMTPEAEYEFYARAENQLPQGSARRRKAPMTAMVPVRFPQDVLDEVRRRADADHRSLSSWIRLAVEHELRNSA